jgi:hypothetical protein
VGQSGWTGWEPILEHISARWQDLEVLLDGLVKTDSRLEKSGFHPVLTAAMIALITQLMKLFRQKYHI